MKRKTIVFILMFGSISLLFAQDPTITVRGSSELHIEPDWAQLHIVAVTKDDQVYKAKLQSDQIIANVGRLCLQLGINKGDIKTEYIRIQPQDSRTSMGGNYQVERGMIINLRNLTKFEDLITGIFNFGVSRINSISFHSSQEAEWKDKARTSAIQEARQKADLMARELETSTGKVQNITEEDLNITAPYFGQGSSTLYYHESESGGHLEKFTPGKITITASVLVTFGLRQ